jgi:peptidoglycan/xylan/chitin deacetylase (PgdA/CDA1 family)
MTTTPSGGVFTISLDFELFWGMADIQPLDRAYRDQLLRTRDHIVPALLDRFEERRIHATWATVGLLMFESRDQLEAGRPLVEPAYADPSLSAYRHLDHIGPTEAADPYHLAPSIIGQIRATPGQEVGCHSFSHYYCLEDGADDVSFAADLDAWRRAAAGHGLTATSICFGRNQYAAAFIDRAAEAGFACYRGTEPAWFNRPRARRDDRLVRRLVRYADTYLPLTRHHCPGPDEIVASTPANVASSRFLRAHNRRLRRLEPLKLRRVLAGLEHAARTGTVYHLWWHPQDLAVDTGPNLDMLDRILERFDDLRHERDMRSMNMGEVVAWARSRSA